MHLVRNSVDHGIEEDAADRERVGKPAKGNFFLFSYALLFDEKTRFIEEINVQLISLLR